MVNKFHNANIFALTDIVQIYIKRPCNLTPTQIISSNELTILWNIELVEYHKYTLQVRIAVRGHQFMQFTYFFVGYDKNHQYTTEIRYFKKSIAHVQFIFCTL